VKNVVFTISVEHLRQRVGGRHSKNKHAQASERWLVQAWPSNGADMHEQSGLDQKIDSLQMEK
jgi:hypothetical protein